MIGFIAGIVYSLSKTMYSKPLQMNKDLIPLSSSSSQSNADAVKDH